MFIYNSVKREPAKMSCVVARGGCAHFCYVSVVFMTTHTEPHYSLVGGGDSYF